MNVEIEFQGVPNYLKYLTEVQNAAVKRNAAEEEVYLKWTEESLPKVKELIRIAYNREYLGTNVENVRKYGVINGNNHKWGGISVAEYERRKVIVPPKSLWGNIKALFNPALLKTEEEIYVVIPSYEKFSANLEAFLEKTRDSELLKIGHKISENHRSEVEKMYPRYRHGAYAYYGLEDYVEIVNNKTSVADQKIGISDYVLSPRPKIDGMHLEVKHRTQEYIDAASKVPSDSTFTLEQSTVRLFSSYLQD